MRYAPISFVLTSVLMGGCTPPAVTQQSNDSTLMNPPINAALTCGEFLPLIRSHDKTVGVTILWLDGYHSGRAGLPELSAGWLKTVSQGVGGTCALNVNASRPVLDVIAQLHREYGGVMAPRP
jgi:hypothetical protein